MFWSKRRKLNQASCFCLILSEFKRNDWIHHWIPFETCARCRRHSSASLVFSCSVQGPKVNGSHSTCWIKKRIHATCTGISLFLGDDEGTRVEFYVCSAWQYIKRGSGEGERRSLWPVMGKWVEASRVPWSSSKWWFWGFWFCQHHTGPNQIS